MLKLSLMISEAKKYHNRLVKELKSGVIDDQLTLNFVK